MKPCNIVDVIRTETAPYAGQLAVVDGALELTYAALLDAMDSVAATLRAQDVQPLERVAFLCEDGADYIIASLAVLQVGAVVVPVSPSLMGDELEQVLERMEVSALLYDGGACARRDGQPLSTAGLHGREFFWLRRTPQHALPPAYAQLNPAFIRFSSGTTGASKGVLLSHDAIVARTDLADQGLRVTAQDVVLWVLSMSFHFVVTILLFLRRGATIRLCRQPFPEAFIQAVQQRAGTLLYASPFHYQLLAGSPHVAADGLAQVRLAVSTAMKLDEATAAAFAHKFGFELVEAYGIIEVGLPCLNLGPPPRPRGCVGRVLPGYEARVAAPNAEGVGELQFRGAGLFEAYVSPWSARDTALPDGWFHTGDLGRIDAAGRVFVLGREKSVINFMGMKIFPDEVEAVLDTHPAVQESLVRGLPHPLYGQMPVAQLTLHAGAVPPTTQELRRFCYQRLAAHKVPKEFQYVNQLEHTGSGKLKRV